MDDINSLNMALIECVKAAGGSKVVANKLWPEKPLADAQRLLLACLNEDRPEKLSPDQAFFIVGLAKHSGSHFGIEFICKSLGYSIPTPIEPDDEKAQLMREFIEASKQIGLMADKLKTFGVSSETGVS